MVNNHKQDVLVHGPSSAVLTACAQVQRLNNTELEMNKMDADDAMISIFCKKDGWSFVPSRYRIQ